MDDSSMAHRWVMTHYINICLRSVWNWTTSDGSDSNHNSWSFLDIGHFKREIKVGGIYNSCLAQCLVEERLEREESLMHPHDPIQDPPPDQNGVGGVKNAIKILKSFCQCLLLSISFCKNIK